MKMKKTLALIITSALTVGTMAGCSQATLNYSKELANTARWGATTSEITGAVNIDAQGIKEEVTFTATGYATKNQSYVDMKFNNTSGMVNIPELKVYSDGTTSYINKSFYEGIYAMSGQTGPTGLDSIKEEYIAIDSTAVSTSAASGIDVDKIKALSSKPDAMIQVGKLMFGEKNNFDIPFVQKGREYTLNLDANQAVDLAAKAIKAGTNNLENLNTTFGLQLKAEDIAQIKTAVNDEKFDTSLNDVKTLLAGTTITSKDAFTDNGYNSDCNINLQIKDFGKITIEMKSKATKSEVKEIILPTSKVKLTAEEFVRISAPTNTNIESTTNTVAK